MIDWNSSGRLLYSFWPLKVNARWPAARPTERYMLAVPIPSASDLVLNFWQRYGGGSPFKHLNTMVASLTASCLMIGSHFNCLRIGVTWSNFLVPESIRAAKFCTVCNSSMFFLVVLAHTDEQYLESSTQTWKKSRLLLSNSFSQEVSFQVNLKYLIWI